jgi:hypothetical protein
MSGRHGGPQAPRRSPRRLLGRAPGLPAHVGWLRSRGPSGCRHWQTAEALGGVRTRKAKQGTAAYGSVGYRRPRFGHVTAAAGLAGRAISKPLRVQVRVQHATLVHEQTDRPARAGGGQDYRERSHRTTCEYSEYPGLVLYVLHVGISRGDEECGAYRRQERMLARQRAAQRRRTHAHTPRRVRAQALQVRASSHPRAQRATRAGHGSAGMKSARCARREELDVYSLDERVGRARLPQQHARCNVRRANSSGRTGPRQLAQVGARGRHENVPTCGT